MPPAKHPLSTQVAAEAATQKRPPCHKIQENSSSMASQEPSKNLIGLVHISTLSLIRFPWKKKSINSQKLAMASACRILPTCQANRNSIILRGCSLHSSIASSLQGRTQWRCQHKMPAKIKHEYLCGRSNIFKSN